MKYHTYILCLVLSNIVFGLYSMNTAKRVSISTKLTFIVPNPPPYETEHKTHSHIPDDDDVTFEYRLLLASFISSSFLVNYDIPSKQYMVSYGTRSTGTYTEIPFNQYKQTIDQTYQRIVTRKSYEADPNDPVGIFFNYYRYMDHVSIDTLHTKEIISKKIFNAFKQKRMPELSALTQRKKAI